MHKKCLRWESFAVVWLPIIAVLIIVLNVIKNVALGIKKSEDKYERNSMHGLTKIPIPLCGVI